MRCPLTPCKSSRPSTGSAFDRWCTTNGDEPPPMVGSGPGQPTVKGRSVGRRSGEAPGKGVCGVAPVHLGAGPGQARATLVEEGHADYPDVPSLALHRCVGVADRAESKGCHCVHAASKAVDGQGGEGMDHIAPLFEGTGLAVDHVEPVDGSDYLESLAGTISNLDDVALTVFADDVVAARDLKAGQRLPAIVEQSNGSHSSEHVEAAIAMVRERAFAGHGVDSGAVVVKQSRQRKGLRRVRSIEARVPNLTEAVFTPLGTQTRPGTLRLLDSVRSRAGPGGRHGSHLRGAAFG